MMTMGSACDRQSPSAVVRESLGNGDPQPCYRHFAFRKSSTTTTYASGYVYNPTGESCTTLGTFQQHHANACNKKNVHVFIHCHTAPWLTTPMMSNGCPPTIDCSATVNGAPVLVIVLLPQ